MTNLYEFIWSPEFVEYLPQGQKYTILTDGPLGTTTDRVRWCSFENI
jgi:hypothetical protein